MNKVLIFTICTLFVLLSPVFASNTNNGTDIQQIQNGQDVYVMINSWFSGLVQNFDPLNYITQNSNFQNLNSSMNNTGDIQTQFNNFLQTNNIQSTINSTLQNIMAQANLNDLMNNPNVQNIINTLKGYTNQN